MEKQCGRKFYDFNVPEKLKKREKEYSEFTELLSKVETKMKKVQDQID